MYLRKNQKHLWNMDLNHCIKQVSETGPNPPGFHPRLAAFSRLWWRYLELGSNGSTSPSGCCGGLALTWFISGWWLSPTPLKNMRTRQLGWWNSQWKKKIHVPVTTNQIWTMVCVFGKLPQTPPSSLKMVRRKLYVMANSSKRKDGSPQDVPGMVNVHNDEQRSTIFHGKTHYFNGVQ